MKKEITKSITETVVICDICNEPANYMCSVCYRDICGAHMIIITLYNDGNIIYLCSECNKKPFSEIWNKICDTLKTKITIYPVIKYQYRYANGTGDYWSIPTITISSNTLYTKE